MKASPMNSNEEIKCDECNEVIFEKEMFMLCQIKEDRRHPPEFKLRNFCCNCFKGKIENDIENVKKWSAKTINELDSMMKPILDYMQSDTKKQIDDARKMLKVIENEKGI